MYERSRRLPSGVVLVALVAFGAAACSSSSKGVSTPSTSASSSTSAAAGAGSVTTAGSGAPTTTGAAGASTGHVGDTLTDPDKNLPSDVATVTLVKVIDPVTPVTASNVPDPGSRWVGLEMTFVDNGDNAADASNEAVATGSDGKVYAMNADIEGAFSECTSTMHDLVPNHKATFCPGFLLPKGVTIAKVGYSARATDSSQPQDITWTVP
jgi:hypothetical protein